MRNFRSKRRACRNGLVLLIINVAVAGCSDAGDEGDTQRNGDPDAGPETTVRNLDEIRASGTLRVLTRNAPTTWYIDKDGQPAGPEHDLVEAFADELGVEVDYQLVESVSELLTALARGEADLAAAGLTVTPQRQQHYRFGPSYQDVTQQVVCRRDRVQPGELGDLVGLDIRVIADSSYSETLQQIKAERFPELDWSESDTADTEQLMHRVWQGEFDCTVADSNIVDINRRYYPELIAPLNLRREEPLAWLLPDAAAELDAAISDWLQDYQDAGRLAAWDERHYGFFEVFDYVDIRAYIRRIDKRFPQYRNYFRKAAQEHDLPFTLLAAQGYQESHWNAQAESPTGVRGIMMLTQGTARAMGVENRLDPRQSIFGGARYLARMKQRFVDEVSEPDRTWLALAAYNVGRGHLHDAQTLARRQGRSPHTWRDIKQVLPLLADKRYYTDLKYGYARGTEPVRYVQRIREYRHVLRQEQAD